MDDFIGAFIQSSVKRFRLGERRAMGDDRQQVEPAFRLQADSGLP